MQPFNWLSLIFFVLLVACERPLPTFDSVNLDVWKTDSQGCTGKRSELESNIREEKDKLLGLNEKQVIRLLGRPDQNELYKRNQKFYTYFVSAGPTCTTPAENPKKLIVRFNAMGLANEVTLE